MEVKEQQRFDTLYAHHLRALKLRGYSTSTIDVYARAVRRLTDYFDCVPDQLSLEQLETYFAELVDARSWGTVRVDRNGLQLFWKFILKQDWRWVEMIKPPKVRCLPDVLSVAEVQQLISVARQNRYRVFVLTKVFRGKLLHEIVKAGLKLPPDIARKWVVDCRHAGRGESALEYLSRYLYRGVVSESNIIANRNGKVMFRYTDGKSKETRMETLPGEDFIWRVIQHVLPRGFHRVRDYGFLHHNARKLLHLLQLILRVIIKPLPKKERLVFRCSVCGQPMLVVGVSRPSAGSRLNRQAMMGRAPPQAAVSVL